YAAIIAGADWIIPYFGRLRRSGIDACERVAEMARLLQATSSSARLLAASMKAPADIIEATLAGAHDITAQPAIISALSADALTIAALAQFDADWAKVGAALG